MCWAWQGFSGYAAQRREGLELPAPHAQQQGVALAVSVVQFLVGQVLLREILRHPLQPLQEGGCQAAADGACLLYTSLLIALCACPLVAGCGFHA